MKSERRRYYLLNFVFLVGLITLFINDHFLKWEFSNWFTGKLSDFAGILILPMVLSFIFPNSIKSNVIGSGIFFLFWKSSISQPFIDFYNIIAPIKIERIVDYSDLIALIFLPVSYILINKIDDFEKLKIQIKGLNPHLLLCITAFVFMATSRPRSSGFTVSNGELQCHKCTQTLKIGKKELLEELAKNGYTIRIDSFPGETNIMYDIIWKDSTDNLVENYSYYKIDTIVIDKDTITDFQFVLEEITEDKTKVWINGMNISKKIPGEEVERKLMKYYRRLIEKHIEKSITANGSDF